MNIYAFVHSRMNSLRRFAIILTVDLVFLNASVLFSVYLLQLFKPNISAIPNAWLHFIIMNLLFILFSYIGRLPFQLWEFTSIKEVFILFWVVLVTKVLHFPYLLSVAPGWRFPVALLITSIFVTLPAMLAPRLFYRMYYEWNRLNEWKQDIDPNKRSKKRILIVGAGAAGEKIAREIDSHPELRYQVVGYVDDNPNKHNTILRGNRVFGPIRHIRQYTHNFHIDEVLIAIPTASGDLKRNILSQLADTNVHVRTLPGIYEMVGGRLNISSIRKIQAEDLLDREPIKTDISQITGYLKGKVILVTGAGGSIGSELSRQITKYNPKQLLLLGRGENRIFYIHQELMNKQQFHAAVPIIGDIRDKEKMQWLFSTYQPDIVFHAAAHKHVPLMELNPDEAMNNNIRGSLNLLQTATENHVKKFINISTDKAVNPINVMGASKRVVELLVKSFNGKNGLKCTSVRFGNVLGSAGSVMDIFKRQIEEDRIIRITDPKMERYFMLIPEAVQLVLEAGAIAQGDDLFVLNMGKQVNILEFAKSFIKLCGLELNKDVRIEIIGNRGNEKLSEELWYEGAHLEKTDNPWIIKVVCNSKKDHLIDFLNSSEWIRPGVIHESKEGIKRELYKYLQL